jgi:hypothetical protein
MRGNKSPVPPGFNRPKGRGIKPQEIKDFVKQGIAAAADAEFNKIRFSLDIRNNNNI